jgi:DUF2934 family protein
MAKTKIENVTRTSDRTAKKTASALTLDKDAIARRAYEIYLARGRAAGDAVADWLEAERELNQRATRARARYR